MPLDLTPTQAAKVHADAQPARADMAKRADYYDGKHAILKREERYADGTLKSNRVANWVKYIVNRYVGLLTSTPYQVTAKDEGGDNQVGTIYGDVADANDLARLDNLHLRVALCKGHSVEIHGWANGAQTIDASDPLEWAFIKDARGGVVGAIRIVEIAAGTFYDGAVLADALSQMTVYDDKTIRVYKRSKAAGASAEWAQVSEIAHEFSRVPVLEMTLNDQAVSAITDALIGLQDEFNEIFSTAGDDVRRMVDALLLISGHDPKWVSENETLIATRKVLPVTEQGDAKFITKTSDTEPISQHLVRTREAIHMSGEVPDVEQMVGATGATSGIALELKFLPMLQNTNTMIQYIKAGVRARIDLINDRLAMLRKPLIVDYNVIVQVSLPVNRIEEWQNVGALKGIVSHRKQLELLSDVGDPEQELRRMESEAADAGAIDAVANPVGAIAAGEAAVAKGMPDMSALAANLLDTLTSLAHDRLTTGGTIDRIIAAQRG